MNYLARLLAGIFVMVVMSGCESSPRKIREVALKELKSKYSPEEINYFYETVFYQDYAGVKPELSKWQEDILISIKGNGWEGDSAYVKDALKQINDMHLPIKLELTGDSSKSNAMIHFGDLKYLSTKLGADPLVPFRGIGKIDHLPGGGLVATIGISNDALSYSHLGAAEKRILRQSTILEEITQILGITGDSWKDYRSIFFEGRKNITQLQPIDKQVIRLLYEESIPQGLTREMFAEQFGDVLYASDTKRKLTAFARKHQVSADQLRRISNASYPDSLLVRYSGEVFVKLLGDFDDRDRQFCTEAIDLLNTASDRFHLVYTAQSPSPDLPCINISFETRPDAAPSAERTVRIGSLMISRRIEGNIRLKSGKAGFSEDDKHRLLFKAIYKIMGYDGITEDVVTRDSSGHLRFLPGYKEALQLLYNPVMADGLLKSDLDEVIRDLK